MVAAKSTNLSRASRGSHGRMVYQGVFSDMTAERAGSEWVRTTNGENDSELGTVGDRGNGWETGPSSTLYFHHSEHSIPSTTCMS